MYLFRKAKLGESFLDYYSYIYSLPNKLNKCKAKSLSFFSSGVSNIKYIRSNLLNKEGGNIILYMILFLGLYLDSYGFAAANIAVLAFNVQTIPAFAIEIYYYSITSCNTVLVLKSILSNSSMQQIP